MVPVIAKLRAARLERRIAPLMNLYERLSDARDVRSWQLRRLNELWRQISARSPYYARLRSQVPLPTSFASLEEFSSVVPSIDRATLDHSVAEISLRPGRADYWRKTGGSTSEPLRLPARRSEDDVTGARAWFARRWFGIEPSDRLFLLWGHSHLLGDGMSGWIGARKRALKDLCLGYVRHSAYDLSDESLRAAGELILRHRPAYIVGYSGALHRLAVVNHDRRAPLRELALKVVIATGESFPFPDSEQLIAETFGAPVAMEYGAVETGVVAHQHPGGDFRVFWDTCYVEGIESANHSGSYEILVTSLYPRLVPLLRYRLGDLVTPLPGTMGLERGFSRVIGRCNDTITLRDGSPVHSEAFSHVLRDIDQIVAFQVVQHADREIVVDYIAGSPLSGEVVAEARRKLNRIDACLATTAFRHVERLQTSPAGKTKRIMSALGSGY